MLCRLRIGHNMQRMAISSAARKSLCARAAKFHSLWLMCFCLARAFAEAELDTSVTSLRTSLFVKS